MAVAMALMAVSLIACSGGSTKPATSVVTPTSATTSAIASATSTISGATAPPTATPVAISTPTPISPGASSWSVRVVGNDLQIGYGSGLSYPQYASLDLSSSYFRLVESTTANWGTSAILLPAFWSSTSTCPPSGSCQAAPVRATWSVSDSSLILAITGMIGGLAVSLTVRLDPPANNQIVASVSASVSGSVTLDVSHHPWEAFKPLMLSSMHVSSTQWDTQAASVAGRSYTVPSCCWIIDPPVTSSTFELIGGTSAWKANAPSIQVALDRTLSVTGWVTSDTNPNDDNVGFWAASSTVLPSWSYQISAALA
jgi:hypothetical protein